MRERRYDDVGVLQGNIRGSRPLYAFYKDAMEFRESVVYTYDIFNRKNAADGRGETRSCEEEKGEGTEGAQGIRAS